MRILVAGALGLLILLAIVVGLLVEAHLEIRGVAPPLPGAAELQRLTTAEDGPVSIHYLNSATQRTGGATPIVHPAFLIQWRDGRGLLIDVGMDRAGAESFGRSLELLLGSDPIEPHGAIAEQLGPAVHGVRAVAFTHLHVDHTGGLDALCAAGNRPLRILQTRWQADLENYGTSPGRKQVEAAGCAKVERLDGSSIFPLPRFPGIVALAAGGHTPGSTLYVAKVQGRYYVLAGDITNFMAALRENRPKPAVYSLLIVPEAPERLEALRLWLKELDDRPDFSVMVSHDGDALAAGNVPLWSAQAR